MGTAHPLAAARTAGRTVARTAALRALACGLLLWAAGTAAHPYHTSFAELGWSAAGDALEVSLRVLPEDLETALTWRSGRAVRLVSGGGDDLLAAYLAEHFQVRDGSGRVLPLELAGLEVAYDETWIYFTVAARPESRLTLRNTLLMDVESTQTNRVRTLWAAPGDALVLTGARPEAFIWRGR